MRRTFAKSLDRPIDVFGIKGKWLSIFLWMAGGSIFLAIVVGVFTSTGMAIGSAILLVASSFVFCLMIQGKVSHRQVGKSAAAGKGYCYIKRHESIASVLYVDPRYEKVMKAREERCRMVASNVRKELSGESSQKESIIYDRKGA